MTQPPVHDVEHVTSSDLITQAGITPRRLDYWVRTGRLIPLPREDTHGSGRPRTFPVNQVRLARTMRQLTGAGLALDVAHTAALQLIEVGHADLHGFTLTPDPTREGDDAS